MRESTRSRQALDEASEFFRIDSTRYSSDEFNRRRNDKARGRRTPSCRRRLFVTVPVIEA